MFQVAKETVWTCLYGSNGRKYTSSRRFFARKKYFRCKQKSASNCHVSANSPARVPVWVKKHPPADFCQNDALFTSFSGMFCQSIGSGCCFFLAQYNTCVKFASLTPEVTFFASASYFSRTIEYASFHKSVASVYKLERTSRLRTLFHKSVANFRSSVIVWVCICTFVVNAHPPADFCQNDALFTSFSGMFCQSIGSGC